MPKAAAPTLQEGSDLYSPAEDPEAITVNGRRFTGERGTVSERYCPRKPQWIRTEGEGLYHSPQARDGAMDAHNEFLRKVALRSAERCGRLWGRCPDDYVAIPVDRS